MSDQAVTLETFAAILGVSRDTISRRVACGEIPAPDIRCRKSRLWRLTTIRKWNPTAAAKLKRGFDSEIFPPIARTAA